MFEEEAEEYTENPKSAWKQGMTCVGSVRQAFKDGAEFGYNKAKEEMQENGLALQSDMDKTIEQNLQLKKELNNANEWHKVADGDLPSEEGGWVCNQNGLPCFFDWGTEQWLDCEGTQIRTTEWCHMPHKE